eukprot:TRINITY_DN8018_c0_g1_i1.p2 TRINITY_DN8018_c0_g1~~TRINITY_DN8018_c0_g1_i1.p2  ORF type:complete len:134 (-),score=11.25 TRINITY_DN8018_c0_g1_i1:202-603(-)
MRNKVSTKAEGGKSGNKALKGKTHAKKAAGRLKKARKVDGGRSKEQSIGKGMDTKHEEQQTGEEGADGTSKKDEQIGDEGISAAVTGSDAEVMCVDGKEGEDDASEDKDVGSVSKSRMSGRKQAKRVQLKKRR